MIAEVISVGSELTSGQSLDTNAAWISKRLSENGIVVGWHTTLADNMQSNVEALRIALTRARLIVMTGGLGPTLDDLTRDVVAKVANAPLVLDPDSLQRIEAMFQHRQRVMPPANRVQAMFPEGSRVIANPRGTAPGIWKEVGDRVIVCLPGVPREMYGMFEEDVLPRVAERFGGGKVTVHRVIRCFGAGESQIEAMLGDLTRRGRDPEIGITASQATISLRLSASAANADAARAALVPDAELIRQKLGDLVYGEGDDELQHVVARLLKENGKTLATAESCTGGLVGHLLTEIPGVSKNYLGGVVAYSNQAKRDFLDVPDETLAAHGAVSAETAEAMAQGVRRRFQSDLAVAITGIAGPDGGSPEKPVGLVFASLASDRGFKTVKFVWGNDRSFTKICSAKMALNLVRLYFVRAHSESQ